VVAVSVPQVGSAEVMELPLGEEPTDWKVWSWESAGKRSAVDVACKTLAG